jgi:NADH:ubiquinone reductase (H+-translocating)
LRSKKIPGPAPKVVVIGAGFAGLSAAKHLAGHGMEIMIVDRNNFHTFQPLLYQIATAGLDASDVAYPVRTIMHRKHDVGFRHGEVASIDVEGRSVELEDGEVLPYDDLVVATGAAAEFFGITGADVNTHPLYTLRDASELRDLLLQCVEDAEARPERHHDGALCIVVVGGGATGVETSGAIVELLEVVRKHDNVHLDWKRTKVVLVDAAGRLLGSFHEKAGRYALDTLRHRGIEVRLDTPVAQVTPDGVRLRGNSSSDRQSGSETGDLLEADVVVWAGGVTVNGTLAATLPAKTAKGGRISVEDDLSIADHPEVSVVGDAASVPLAPGAPAAPQLAQVAIQSGRHAAEQIVRRHTGQPTVAFRYHDKGQMATIGRRAAVAQLRHGPIIRGVLGWAAWLGLHLVYLMGFRNRLIVLVNWTWRYFDWPSGPRLILGDEGHRSVAPGTPPDPD